VATAAAAGKVVVAAISEEESSSSSPRLRNKRRRIFICIFDRTKNDKKEVLKKGGFPTFPVSSPRHGF
jgi:hypothetical protein